jgi:predicted enzyme related to lactoylglutathione lyase
VPNPVTHFEIVGKDGKKLHSFYSQLFGWQVEGADNPMEYGTVTPQEGRGTGGGIGTAPEARVIFYVEVDKVQPFLDKAASMGGRVVEERTVLPGMVTFAMFADPEGNVIGLAESEVPPA